MNNSWHGGKGSKPRPIEDRKQFEDNWDNIFKKKPEKRNEQKRSTPRRVKPMEEE